MTSTSRQGYAHDLVPLPTAGRPLTSVHQINYALRRLGETVYAELADGKVEQICESRRKAGDFQVRLATDRRWESAFRRVWAAKGCKGANTTSLPVQAAQPSDVSFQRTDAGNLAIEDLQARFFQEPPTWLETPTGHWLIWLQAARRRLVCRRWPDDHAALGAATLAELAVLMRTQDQTRQLLHQEEQRPFRGWLIVTPIVLQHATSSETETHDEER